MSKRDIYFIISWYIAYISFILYRLFNFKHNVNKDIIYPISTTSLYSRARFGIGGFIVVGFILPFIIVVLIRALKIEEKVNKYIIILLYISVFAISIATFYNLTKVL